MSLWHAYPAYASARWSILTQQDRFVELLREWDEDGDGNISSKEFADACRVLLLDAKGLQGTKVPRPVLDELYEEMDVDGAGNIALDDLVLALRLMPIPDEPIAALIRKDVLAPSRRSRTQRRSKSLPSSPTASPPTSPRLSPQLLPRKMSLPSIPDTSLLVGLPAHVSPAARRSSCPTLVQPPRRNNLPRTMSLGALGAPGPPSIFTVRLHPRSSSDAMMITGTIRRRCMCVGG